MGFEAAQSIVHACRKKLKLQSFMCRSSMQVETATGEARSGGLSFGSVSDSRNESRKVSQV